MLLEISSVIVEKEQGCLRAQLPFASILFFFLTQDLPEAHEGQSQKPEGQEFLNLISHLSFLDKAL